MKSLDLARLLLLEMQTLKTFEYTIVGIDESDLKLNKVSHLSPIGKALLKQSKGDYVYFETPNGDRELEILEVKVPKLKKAS
jgi:Transcription elongation factor